MRALSPDEVRTSFINATEPELARLELPWWFDATLWDSLDYLGWTDPQLPDRGYLVAETGWGLAGVTLRLPSVRPRGRHALCNLCCTQHRGEGAVLMVARRAGKAGLDHNTVGTYICADLACSLYLRGLRRATGGGRLPETLDPDARTRRLRHNVEVFLSRVAGPPSAAPGTPGRTTPSDDPTSTFHRWDTPAG
ncbi:MAG: FBP domain-containing protein [Propioniciclava sp.]|uniref:FBP domain-containing protein n=1 Tax=Propioniciclava sp. TaxID=2038686 RepID=UPI0039E31AF6